jgi:hypothetical protein
MEIKINHIVNIQNELISDLAQQIINKKTDIILTRILEIDPNFDIEIEKKSKFKKIVCLINKNEETYWYNDGSLNGVRLITFVDPDPFMQNGIDKTFIGYKLKYY